MPLSFQNPAIEPESLDVSAPSMPPFWSPEEELQAKVTENRPRRTSAGPELDAFVSRQHHHERRKSASWHHNPKLSFFDWKEDFLNRLRQTLTVPGALGTPSHPTLVHRENHGDF